MNSIFIPHAQFSLAIFFHRAFLISSEILIQMNEPLKSCWGQGGGGGERMNGNFLLNVSLNFLSDMKSEN